MADEDIIRKIKKALAIANDDASSDGEIAAAMNAVQKMMDKHHLTEADLAHEPQDDYANVDEAAFGRFRVWIGNKAHRWECALAAFVSEFVGVPYYLDSKSDYKRNNGMLVRGADGQPVYGRMFVYYGVAEDAKIAQEVFNELRQIIMTLAFAKFNSVFKGDGGTYSEGFVTGLFAKMNEQKEATRIEAKQQTTSTAMVLVARRDDLVKYKVKAAKDWLKNDIGIKLRSGGRRSGARGGYNSFAEGKSDGKNMEVTKKRCKKLGSA